MNVYSADKVTYCCELSKIRNIVRKEFGGREMGEYFGFEQIGYKMPEFEDIM